MKRNIARRTLVILSLATLYLSLAATAQALSPACSLALTAGKWGFTTNGTVVGIGPRASTGILTLDALDLVFDDNVRELRAIFTSVVLPNGTPLATVITVEAKKMFAPSTSEE